MPIKFVPASKEELARRVSSEKPETKQPTTEGEQPKRRGRKKKTEETA